MASTFVLALGWRVLSHRNATIIYLQFKRFVGLSFAIFVEKRKNKWLKVPPNPVISKTYATKSQPGGLKP